MGDLYLSWLPDVVGDACRSVGYTWSLFDSSWLYRARSSGGYDSNPLCVMWHHTAGGDDAWSDAHYMCHSADAAPIANLVIDSRVCLILAGGATNTNGSGSNSPMTFSRGTVAVDDMNRRAIGIEICNNGVGAPYPAKQIDCLFAISNALNAKCGNQPTDVCTHQHYAPERKIDPSTAAAVQGSWQPRAVAGGSWNVDDLRAECQRRAGGGGSAGPDPELPEDEDMVWRVAKLDTTGAFYLGDGNKSYWVADDGGDITMAESLIRMAPGAVNVKPFVSSADQPEMVTDWNQVGTINATNMKRYVGENTRL